MRMRAGDDLRRALMMPSLADPHKALLIWLSLARPSLVDLHEALLVASHEALLVDPREALAC